MNKLLEKILHNNNWLAASIMLGIISILLFLEIYTYKWLYTGIFWFGVAIWQYVVLNKSESEKSRK